MFVGVKVKAMQKQKAAVLIELVVRELVGNESIIKPRIVQHSMWQLYSLFL